MEPSQQAQFKAFINTSIQMDKVLQKLHTQHFVMGEPVKKCKEYIKCVEYMAKGWYKFTWSCVGNLNAGKSTFLNTLIGDTIFPRSSAAETAVLTLLQYDDECTVPYLYQKKLSEVLDPNYGFFYTDKSSLSTPLAIGTEAIYKKLQHANKIGHSSSEGSTMVNIIRYRITWLEKTIHNKEFRQRMQFADFPGEGDPRIKEIKLLTTFFKNEHYGVLQVLEATNIQNSQIFLAHPEIETLIKSQRIMWIANKFDLINFKDYLTESQKSELKSSSKLSTKEKARLFTNSVGVQFTDLAAKIPDSRSSEILKTIAQDHSSLLFPISSSKELIITMLINSQNGENSNLSLYKSILKDYTEEDPLLRVLTEEVGEENSEKEYLKSCYEQIDKRYADYNQIPPIQEQLYKITMRSLTRMLKEFCPMQVDLFRNLVKADSQNVISLIYFSAQMTEETTLDLDNLHMKLKNFVQNYFEKRLEVLDFFLKGFSDSGKEFKRKIEELGDTHFWIPSHRDEELKKLVEGFQRETLNLKQNHQTKLITFEIDFEQKIKKLKEFKEGYKRFPKLFDDTQMILQWINQSFELDTNISVQTSIGFFQSLSSVLKTLGFAAASAISFVLVVADVAILLNCVVGLGAGGLYWISSRNKSVKQCKDLYGQVAALLDGFEEKTSEMRKEWVLFKTDIVTSIDCNYKDLITCLKSTLTMNLNELQEKCNRLEEIMEEIS